MPYSPPSLCSVPGCGNLVASGRCAEHRAEGRREAEARRPKGHGKPYDSRWAAFAKAFLKRHPLCECEECAALPQWRRPTATDVDHMDGRGPTGPRGYDERNLQALSHAHHSRKTALHDGGFGHAKRATNDWA